MTSKYISKQDVYIPTPEEIRERAASIRESWTEEETRKRAGLERNPHWMPQTVSIQEIYEAREDNTHCIETFITEKNNNSNNQTEANRITSFENSFFSAQRETFFAQQPFHTEY